MKQLEKYAVIHISSKRLTIKELVDLKIRVFDLLKHSECLSFDFSNVVFIDSCMTVFFNNLTKKVKIRITNVSPDVFCMFKYCHADSVIQFQNNRK